MESVPTDLHGSDAVERLPTILGRAKTLPRMREPLKLGPAPIGGRRPSRLRIIIGRVALILLACGLVFLWLLHGYDRSRQKRAARQQQNLPALAPPSQEKAAARRSVALEDQRREIDETVWARELLAEKHGKVVAAFWDNLRRADDKVAVLGNLSFTSLILPDEKTTTPVENGITLTHLRGAGRRLSQGAWREFLRTSAADGYQLVQSEWRHVEFEPPTPGSASSTVEMILHLARSSNEERVVVRGDLKVTWHETANPFADPALDTVEVVALEVLSRTGPPPFRQEFIGVIDTNSVELADTIIVYDVEADSRPEILLPQRNVLLSIDSTGQFRPATLCQHPAAAIHAALVADFTGDGAADLLTADRDGLLLFAGDSQGKFADPGRRIQFTVAELSNPSVLTTGDLDSDGDLDLWVGQSKPPYVDGQMPTPFYNANDGFPSFLLINDGMGGFSDMTAQAGLAEKRFRRVSSASFADLDNDGDLDLLVVSDFAGIDLYFNNGRGRFSDVTPSKIDHPHAFGKGLAFGDFDLNGALDFIVTGVYSHTPKRLNALGLEVDVTEEFRQMRSRMAGGNLMLFQRNGSWTQTELSGQAAESGWAWGVASLDFDNDGDLDVYVANGHRSRESVLDYESHFWRHDIYVGNSTRDPAVDTYFRSVASRFEDAGQSLHGYEKNRFFVNQGGASFLEAGFLAGIALEDDSRCVVKGDLDNDGRMDLIVTSQQSWPETRQTLRVFRNEVPAAGNWIGFHFRETPLAAPIIGSKIIVTTAKGQKTAQVVTGDSFRSQHPLSLHFGLGDEAQVPSVEIRWSNGTIQRFEYLPTNRYHILSPPERARG